MRISRPEALLLVATAGWGISFLLTASGVGAFPLLFVGTRFGVACGLALAIGAVRRDWGGIDAARPAGRAPEALPALLIGAAMTVGYGAQAVAMHAGAPSGRVAFVTALYVPLVPLGQTILDRRPPRPAVWAACALACAGLMLLAGPGASAASGGDRIALLAPLGVSAEILLVARFAPRVRLARLVVGECAVVALAALALHRFTGEAAPHGDRWLAFAVFLGALSTVLQFAITWGQARVSAVRATLIYTLEPVWAGLFGALAGETVTVPGLVGAGLILASLLLSAWR